jgi:hypothetical protein
VVFISTGVVVFSTSVVSSECVVVVPSVDELINVEVEPSIEVVVDSLVEVVSTFFVVVDFVPGF